MVKYNQNFLLKTYNANRYSAEMVLPILFDVVEVRSVVDVGCGLGTWLEVARQLGVDSILGIDGPWLKDEENLKVDQNQLVVQNLNENLKLESKFDLAISLEVAEHLSEARADTFVDDICSLSDLILFSAAIPGQGGSNHINEQWQSYWSKRFELNDYRAYDFIRQQIWAQKDIQSYHRQNIVIYCRAESAEDAALETIAPAVTNLRNLDIVIPEIYLYRTKPHGVKRIWHKHIAPAYRNIRSGFSSRKFLFLA